MTFRHPWFLALLPAIVTAVFGCQSAYYAVWESIGKEKRHLLRDQIENTRSDQEKAAEEFKDALTRVRELTGFSGGELESIYSRLKNDLDACTDRANTIDKRIQNVETIAADLFDEWEAEIDHIQNAGFKASSRQSLIDTRNRYGRLHQAMVSSRDSMDPVLTRLNDYVLFLKHNLNARAVGALGEELGSIESDVQTLIRDIETAISEADRFLSRFEV
ncbi:MAG: DUF2959 family protein [Desulfobacterales bacterium]|jgi:hypothetical protein